MSGQPSRLIAFLYGLVPLMVAASVLFVLVVVGGKAVQGYEMRQEAQALERRIDQLKKENRRLAQELDYYRSDQYVEKVAREEMGLARPNDVAVIIVPPDDRRSLPVSPDVVSAPQDASAQKDLPTWQRWLSIFVGRD